jgi:hypothetical protein
MRRVRVQIRTHRETMIERLDRVAPILALDARDPEIIRVKALRSARATRVEKRG